MDENIMQKRVKWAHKSLALCVILLAERNNMGGTCKELIYKHTATRAVANKQITTVP